MEKIVLKQLFRIFWLPVVAVALTGCHPEAQAVKDLQTLNERVQNESSDWSAADWDDATQQFGEVVQEVAKYDDRYTEQQRADNFRLEQACYNRLREHVTIEE